MEDNLVKWLESLTEPQIYPLIRDLLIAMGFERVTITHGPLEAGKDICFMEHDVLGREIWRGVQVKAVPLTGSFSSGRGIRQLVVQCEAALDTPFITPEGEEKRLSEVWLVSTYPITEHAKMNIRDKLKYSRCLHIIDGCKLRDLIKLYLPNLLEAESKPIEDYLRHLIAFCDAPEEYLAIRMKAKCLTSEVFVEPTCILNVVEPRCFSNGHLLPKVLQVLDQFQYYKTMLAHRLLPLAELNIISEVVHSLALLSESLGTFEWLASKIQILRETSNAVLTDLTGCTIKIEQPETLDTWISYCKPTLDLPRLLSCESMLSEVDIEATEVLRRYRSLMQQVKRQKQRLTNFAIASGEWHEDIESQLARARLSREQFFVELKNAYIGSIDLSKPLVQLASHVAQYFYRDSQVAQISPSSDTSVLRTILADIESSMKCTYERLWYEKAEPYLETDTLNPADKDAMRVLAEINQLTSAICQLFDLTDPRIHSLSFEALDLCKHSDKLIVKGEVGLGKTTLLKRISHIAAESLLNTGNGPIPVLSLLSTVKDCTDTKVSNLLMESAKASARTFSFSPSAEVYWILDGFDEINSQTLRKRILNWCRDSKEGRHILLSSRHHALPFCIPGFTIVSLQPISMDKTELLIRRFPWDDETKPNKLISVLHRSPELSALAGNPLLLMLIIIMATRYDPETLPNRREDIYDSIVCLLLGEWDTAKSISRPHIIRDVALKRKLLQRAAYNLYSKRKRAFLKDEFVAEVMSAIPNRPLSLDDATRLFDELVRDCFLIPLSPQEYGFFHFSLHEYLAAEDLAGDIDTNRIWHVIETYFLSGGWWEEVLVFYGGIKRDVAVLINSLEKHLTKGVAGNPENASLLNLIRRWIDVADFMRIDDLNPRGTVAATFACLNIANDKIRWSKLCQIKG